MKRAFVGLISLGFILSACGTEESVCTANQPEGFDVPISSSCEPQLVQDPAHAAETATEQGMDEGELCDAFDLSCT